MVTERNDQVGWTDGQWNRIRQAVSEEAYKARVAASFLPVYGPLPPSTQVVPSERMDASRGTVDDVSTTRIIEIAVQVTLTQQQVLEDELSSALLLFRRAANIVARLEDWAIFHGRPKLAGDATREPEQIPPRYQVAGGEEEPAGGLSAATIERFQLANPGALGLLEGAGQTLADLPHTGEGLVAGIVEAVTRLEGQGHLGPFVCVLGTDAFVLVNTPTPGSLVLPRDRIEPFLGRTLLRSSTIDDQRWQTKPPSGVVVSLAGDPIDLAVAVEIAPQFLFVNPQARYVFRVFERYALRIKEPEAIITMQFRQTPRAGE